MRKLLIAIVCLSLIATVAVWQRHRLLIYALSAGEAPALLEATDEGPNVVWHDDYFTVERLDAHTFAIGEPRYAQQNYSYLIIGSERALLFDAGPGLRDIRAVAESLTEQPITFVPSHFHYDHTGNQVTFERVAVVDLPYLRARAEDDQLTLTWQEHLGAAEDIVAPTLTVTEWLPPGSTLSLGDRSLLVLYTPGHTEDSISLLDLDNGMLFSGDFIYPGPLFAFLPNSGMGDYLQGAETVLAAAADGTVVLGAHRVAPPGVPKLAMADVLDLQAALLRIKSGDLSGSGWYPREYKINPRTTLLAEPAWLQNWTPRHPEHRDAY
ncbi:MAG: MBL fold metallo-hydrolase [Pseudomonadales bacterium]